MRSVIFFSQTGCLLPCLIILNLFFGRIFFNAIHWLFIELVLVLLFMLNSAILTKKITSFFRKHNNVIDVEGRVEDDQGKTQITENKRKGS